MNNISFLSLLVGVISFMLRYFFFRDKYSTCIMQQHYTSFDIPAATNNNFSSTKPYVADAIAYDI